VVPFPSRLAEAVRLIGDLIGKMEIDRLFVFNLTVRLIRKWKPTEGGLGLTCFMTIRAR